MLFPTTIRVLAEEDGDGVTQEHDDAWAEAAPSVLELVSEDASFDCLHINWGMDFLGQASMQIFLASLQNDVVAASLLGGGEVEVEFDVSEDDEEDEELEPVAVALAVAVEFEVAQAQEDVAAEEPCSALHVKFAVAPMLIH